LENDIEETQKSLSQTGQLSIASNVQIDQSIGDDPFCPSSGCPVPKPLKDEHPMNYKVQNLGMDREILNSLENVPIAEGLVGHKWTSMGSEENKKKFHNVAKDTLYDFDPKLSHEIIVSKSNLNEAEEKLKKKFELVQLSRPIIIQDVMLENGSDPICSSAGCVQYLFPELKDKEDYPMNYKVPNLGMEREILNSLENIPVAEGLVGHKWTGFPTGLKKDGPTLYDFNPKLSHEIIVSKDNLEEAEEKLKKKFELLQLEE
jgi:hypothetical protein